MEEIKEELLNQLVEVIYKRIEERIISQIYKANVELNAEGIVKEISSNNKSAIIETAFARTDHIPNLTGDTLTVNNKVKIFYNRRDMSDAYIGVKY